MDLSAWLLADNSMTQVPLANQVLGVAIWVGVAILTIALLILMRTRWGQVQPLSKCVVVGVGNVHGCGGVIAGRFMRAPGGR